MASPRSSQEKTGVPVSVKECGTGRGSPTLTDSDFDRFRRLILRESGIYLRDTKRHLLMARLTQRLRQLGLDSFSRYYDYLTSDTTGGEMVAFINRITTNKTSFFREPHHFEFLRGKVVPGTRCKRLAIWSSACSSGEEPYSIAITLEEALGPAHGWDIRILASDIDTEMLGRAEAGIYECEALCGVPERIQRAHFLRGYGNRAGLVQVQPEVRRMVQFRRINLIEADWPPQGHFDVVFCRNVIIYFDRATQERIIGRMAGCLKPDGYLFAGHSENLFWMRDLLVPVQPTIYRLNKGEQRK